MVELVSSHTAGARVEEKHAGQWRLSIPAGPAGEYRWAQLDDYQHLRRSAFRWQPPVSFTIQARVSSQTHSGTWGFGYWNDPFSLSLGIQGTARRFPALPNTTWFFFGSAPNHLTLRDDLLGNGMLAGAFSSKPVTPLLLAPQAIWLPLLIWKKTASLPRRWLRNLIKESSVSLVGDWTQWHDFTISMRPEGLEFSLDGQICHETSLVPYGRLGLVMWIDNQFARLAPGEAFRTGTLSTLSETWLDLRLDYSK